MNVWTDIFCEKAPDEIRHMLYSGEYPGKKYCERNGISYKLCDCASLFVMSVFLTEKSVRDKNELRKKAYMTFFENNRAEYPEAWKSIDLLTEDTDHAPDINIRILKGGSYKIKNYYLENYKLADIRGASVLLTHVEEDIIPAMISDRFIPECIVYSGGGNIFAVVPDECDDSFALELEKAAKQLLISADIAYYISKPMLISDVFGKNYKAKMVDVENRLNERKKLIINCAKNAGSEYLPNPQNSPLNLSFIQPYTINADRGQ